MTASARLLLVDDDAAVVDTLGERLARDGYECVRCTDPQAALRALSGEGPFDLVISDIEMPGMRGIDLMSAIHSRHPGQLVLLITGFGTIDLAVQCLRAGATDFLTKPFSFDVLRHAVQRALRERAMRREIVRLRAASQPDADETSTVIARSPAMTRAVQFATRVAATTSTVLLSGESGVGKGSMARLIHDRSPRAREPFVQVNCAAIPPTLVESELFGVRKGAYTDARSDREGLFEQADGGTLFLDEIGDMPLAVQATLLHALESGQVRPVGAETPTSVDVRVIAATNQDLESAVRDGGFRADLYYRLNVLRLTIPPLRDRPEDLLPLLDHLLARVCARIGREVGGIADDALRWLLAYTWPGNVRELANLLERAVVLSEHNILVMSDFTLGGDTEAMQPDDSLQRLARAGWPLARLDRAYAQAMLDVVDGNKSEAAKRLGIDRRTLYRWLDED